VWADYSNDSGFMKIKKMLLNSIVSGVNLLGVQIEKDFVRLVELSLNSHRYRVQACLNIDFKELTDETIIGELKKMDLNSKFVVASLSHSVVTFKEIEVLKNLSSKELEKFLRFTLAKDMGEQENKIIFDYQIIEEGFSKKVQLVAVKAKYVERQIEIFKKLGLCLKAIDVDIYALERAVRHQLKIIKGLVVIINIELGRIFVLVLDDKKIVHMCENFIDAGDKNLLELINSDLEKIQADISQSIYQVILAGKKASCSLVEALGSKLKINVSLVNPFFDVEVSPNINLDKMQKISPMMPVSFGLALRAIKND